MKKFKISASQFLTKTICLIAIISWKVNTGNCQLLSTNNVTLTIASSTQLTVQGDIQNQNAASISNNGTIDLSGNWIHNAANNCFGTSAGTVILNGANQTIGGTNSTLFNNLTLQGSGTKTLLINTTLGGSSATGVLNIGSRNLVLNSKSLFVNNSAPGAITFLTGFITSEQSNNTSTVIWSINATSGAHIIPFGTASSVVIPFTYNLTSGNAGNVTVSTYPTIANNTPLPVIPIAVTHVRNNIGLDNSANTVDRFWQVDASGTPTAALTFTWASAENAANGNTNPRAQRWNASAVAWETPLPSQSNPTVQSVTVSNVNTFGPWAVALSASPLPIQLISFEAQAVDNKNVLCKWITANEINNDYFTIERSVNDKDFEEAGIIDGAGNSNTVSSYSFIDEHPYSGISYYRLKQTDFNGHVSYSKAVAVKIIKNENALLVYPNPASDFLNIEYPSDANGKILYQLIDMSGKIVAEKFVYPNGDLTYTTFNLNGFSKGVYSLRVQSALAIENKRIVIQ